MSGRARAAVAVVAGALDRLGVISADRFDSTMSLAWPRIVTGLAIMSKQTVDIAFVAFAAQVAGLLVAGPAQVARTTTFVVGAISVIGRGLGGLYLALPFETYVLGGINYVRFWTGRWRAVSRRYRPSNG